MINNQSKKPENRIPQDSEQKDIKHPQNDDEAVKKAKDKTYRGKEPHFKNPAKQREQSEQPVHPGGKKGG